MTDASTDHVRDDRPSERTPDDEAADRFRRRAAVRVRDRVETWHLYAGILLAVWVWLYPTGLGEFPLQGWDESRYAVPARNMVASGSWLTPRLQVNTHSQSLEYMARLVKPPLVYWMQAAAMLVFGKTVFAARLPSALATLGTALLVYRMANHTFDHHAGLAGGLVLLVTPQVLSGNHGGRAAVPDAPLLFFGSAFVWLTWRGHERPRLLVPAGVAAGLAVLSKGFAAGVFVVALLPLVAAAREAYLREWRWILAGVASTLVVALPWHLWAYAVYGWSFVDQYVVQAALARIAGGPESYVADPLLWFMNYPYLKQFVIPPLRHDPPVFQVGIVLASVLVWWRVRRDGRGAHADELALLWWTFAVPLTFVVGGGNKAWYVMPMHVPGAALVGYVPAAVLDGTAGAVAAAALDRIDAGPWTDPDRWSARWTAVRARLGSLVPGEVPTERARTGMYVLCCLGLALALATPSPATVPSREGMDDDQHRIGVAIAAETDPGDTIYVNLEVGRAALLSVPFYADRPYERATKQRLRTDESVRYAIVPLSLTRRLDVAHRVVVRGDSDDIAFVVFVDRVEGDGNRTAGPDR